MSGSTARKNSDHFWNEKHHVIEYYLKPREKFVNNIMEYAFLFYRYLQHLVQKRTHFHTKKLFV